MPGFQHLRHFRAALIVALICLLATNLSGQRALSRAFEFWGGLTITNAWLDTEGSIYGAVGVAESTQYVGPTGELRAVFRERFSVSGTLGYGLAFNEPTAENNVFREERYALQAVLRGGINLLQGSYSDLSIEVGAGGVQHGRAVFSRISDRDPPIEDIRFFNRDLFLTTSVRYGYELTNHWLVGGRVTYQRLIADQDDVLAATLSLGYRL